MEYLVIDVGGTNTKYAIMTADCQFVEKGRFKTVTAPLDAFLDSLCSLYRRYSRRITGIALSMPGILDSESGYMVTGGMITCISKQNIVDLLARDCAVPVSVENDARCAALAELWKGALVHCQDAVVLVCGSGIGGAVIRKRELVRGSHNLAGEFSFHLTNDAEPYEQQQLFGLSAGNLSFLKLACERMGEPIEKLDGEVIFTQAGAGNIHAVEAIREYARRVAVQINNYQFVVDPELFAVGGGISAQPLFLRLLHEELEKINRLYRQWQLPLPNVVTCKYCNDSNLIGALYHHRRRGAKHVS